MPISSTPKMKAERKHIGGRLPRAKQFGDISTNLDDNSLSIMLQAIASTQGDFLPLSGGSLSGDITLQNGVDIIAGTTTGSNIGTATNQKLGFYGATPIIPPVLATGAGATVDNVITALQNLGLVTQT